MAVTRAEVLMAIKAKNEAAAAFKSAATDIDRIAKATKGATAAAKLNAAELYRMKLAAQQLGVGLAAVGKQMDVRKYAVGFETVRQSVLGLGTAIKNTAALGATLAAGLTFKTAIDSALEFEKNMSQIQALTNATADDIKNFSNSVGQLSKETLQSPQELAKAFFVVASAGAKGKEALDLLAAGGKAATAGLGDISDLLRVGASAVVNFGDSGLTAARAMDVLTTTANAGNFEVSELAGTLGKILPNARQAGSSFEDIGGAIAVLTNKGLPAAQSVDFLNAIFRQLNRESAQGSKELAKVGLNFDDVRKTIQEKGLLAGLQQLNQAFGGQADAISRFLQDSGAVTAFLALTNGNLEETNKLFNQVANTVDGQVNTSFSKIADTNRGKLLAAQNELNGALLSLGQQILPTVASAASFLAGNLSTLGAVIKDVAIIAGGAGLGLAIQALTGSFTALGGGLPTVVKAFQTLNLVIRANPFIAAGVAIGAIIVALNEMGFSLESVGRLFGVVFKPVLGLLSAIADAFSPVFAAIESLIGPIKGVGVTFDDVVKFFARGIAGMIAGLAEVGKAAVALGRILFSAFRGDVAGAIAGFNKLMEVDVVGAIRRAAAETERSIDDEKFVQPELGKSAVTFGQAVGANVGAAVSGLLGKFAPKAPVVETPTFDGGGGGGGGGGGTTVDQVQQTITKLREQLATQKLIGSEQKLEAKVLEELNQIRSAGQKISEKDAATIRQLVTDVANQEFQNAFKERVADLEEEVRLSGLETNERELQRAVLSDIRSLERDGIKATEEQIAKLRELNLQRSQSEFNTKFTENLKDLQFELSIVGLTNRERERAVELRSLEQDAIRAGVQNVDQYKNAWTQALDAIYDAQQRNLTGLEEFANAAKTTAELSADVTKTIFGGLKDAVGEFVKTGKLDLESLFTSLSDKLADLFVDEAFNQLASFLKGDQGGSTGGTTGNGLLGGLFGSPANGLGGASGGIFGGLFGGGNSSTQQSAAGGGGIVDSILGNAAGNNACGCFGDVLSGPGKAFTTDITSAFSNGSTSFTDSLGSVFSEDGGGFLSGLGESFSEEGGGFLDGLSGVFEGGADLFSGLFDGLGSLFGGGDSGGLFGGLGGLFGGDSGGGLFGGIGSFFGFAKGGVMGKHGPQFLQHGLSSLPRKKYARGGIADRPQIAMFGEGDMNEAYVPLPDGRRIPVRMQGGAGGEKPMQIVNNFNISTPDADSFRSAQPQILASTQKQLQRQSGRNN